MSDNDDDALFESLEKDHESDPSLVHLREARIQQLSSDLSRARTLRTEGYGAYTEIQEEKQLLDITTSHKKCLVHFFKSDFNRCRIMDGHLKKIAEEHLEARICRISVENAPFLVTKLGVKILPCVIAFVDGVSVDRIVGFEGLGYEKDSFETGDLERRLMKAGLLDETLKKLGGLGPKGRLGENAAHGEKSQDEEDEDWD